VVKGFLARAYHQSLHHMYKDQKRKYSMTQEIRMIDVTLLKSKSSRNKRYNFIERSTGD